MNTLNKIDFNSLINHIYCFFLHSYSFPLNNCSCLMSTSSTIQLSNSIFETYSIRYLLSQPLICLQACTKPHLEWGLKISNLEHNRRQLRSLILELGLVLEVEYNLECLLGLLFQLLSSLFRNQELGLEDMDEYLGYSVDFVGVLGCCIDNFDILEEH